jgi:superfamily II DNA/RNA helicase
MNPPAEDRRGGPRGRDSSEDASLSREKNRSQQLQTYNVSDGEFTSFPEIQATTAQQLIARGIKNLFPIQQHSFYPVFNREDVIARDLTGSGKTLAFCLPVTEYLRKNNLLGTRRIQAIMLCPTRELAIQVSLHTLLTFSKKEFAKRLSRFKLKWGPCLSL